jgi:hypothetical protein
LRISILLGKTVHKEHEESQRKKLFASLRDLCGRFSFFQGVAGGKLKLAGRRLFLYAKRLKE